jgi:hypothetical protein
VINEVSQMVTIDMMVSRESFAPVALRGGRVQDGAAPVLSTPKPRPGCWTLPGFLAGTRIRTAFGELPVEALRANDPIVTTRGRVLTLQRIRRIGLDRGFLLGQPAAQPVCIAAGTLGRGLPARDLLVSPGQMLLMAPVGQPARQVSAGQMAGNPQIAQVLRGCVTYFTLEFAEAAFVYAEGVAVLVPQRAVAEQEEEDEAA